MSRGDYWQHKLSVFLHDPVHKCLRIHDHESRAKEIAGLLHQRIPHKQEYQSADWMASGLTRAALPGYSPNVDQNGAVEFVKHLVMTHPLVRQERLTLTLPSDLSVDSVHQEVIGLLKTDIGEGLSADELDRLRMAQNETVPINAHFSYSNAPEQWSQALFAYLFFAFKKRLRAADVGGLGAIWDFLPADTRMPDHPLWHHCSLASALASSMADDPEGKVSLAVFSITPVQQFIAKARKLRDHWVGSVLLSYLTFAGLRYLSQSVGPDHIMYPSLHDQPLMEAWLDREYHIGAFLTEPDQHAQKHNESTKQIASFPNKFVFIVPTARAGEICLSVEEAIQAEWLRVAGLVRDFLAPSGKDGAFVRSLFDHQISDYWQFSFASVRLQGLNDTEDLSALLHYSKWQKEREMVEAFSAPYGDNARRVARLYVATHTAAQTLLAASKLKPHRVRKAQQGEKCPLCGEHEVVHDFSQAGQTNAKKYKDSVKSFWDNMRTRMNSEGSHAQVGKNERLCAVCCVKRFLPRALERHPGELLYEVLRKDVDKFPSTTEIAAHSYLRKLRKFVDITEQDYRRFLDHLHGTELEVEDDEQSSVMREINAIGKSANLVFTEQDKYYALLIMDGDKMGDLINGSTIDAGWGDVIHPELKQRFSRTGFAPSSPLHNRLEQRRTLNPALHAAISDSLNSFARYGAAPAIRKGEGRLIYAGGDDICAILPLESVLETAEAIRLAYNMGFVRITEQGVLPLKGTLAERFSKLGMHLGQAPGISISGAIVIAHHKTPLREVISDAHALLEGSAKDKAGRNSLAICLSKRYGGDREVVFKWDEQNPFIVDRKELFTTSFKSLMEDVADNELASRLLYRLADLRDALAPLVPSAVEMRDNREKILKLFKYEIKHSGKFLAPRDEKKSQEEKVLLLAARLAGICVRKPSAEVDWFTPDAAILARFLALRSTKEKLL